MILIYLPALAVGGAEISLLRLAQGLRSRGLLVAFVVHRIDDAARSLADGIDLYELKVDQTLAAIRPLGALLRALGPSVLISALTHCNVAAVIAARMTFPRTPVIVTEHAPASSMQKINRSRRYRITLRVMPWAYRLADAVVAVSRGVRDDFAPMFGASVRKKFSVIYNPVLRDDWPSLAQAPIDDPWFRDGTDRPIILSVARLSSEKNFPMLIRAFSRLRAAEEVRLAIIGEGPDRPVLQALIDELGQGDRIRLLGQRDNPFAYMHRARIFVLTSRFEGFGNVLVEAMACGLPVISTDCPVGPREILDSGRYGTLVVPDDVDGLKLAMEAQLLDPQPSPGARARALEFSVERSVEAYLALLSKVLPPPEVAR
jgi:glycosyltransferase involved in cell wall biosynthesis